MDDEVYYCGRKGCNAYSFDLDELFEHIKTHSLEEPFQTAVTVPNDLLVLQEEEPAETGKQRRAQRKREKNRDKKKDKRRASLSAKRNASPSCGSSASSVSDAVSVSDVAFERDHAPVNLVKVNAYDQVKTHGVGQKMIGYRETAVLYSLFKDGEKRPFEEIIIDFTSKLPPSLHLPICSALVMLLKTPKCLRPTERLVAFALLHHAYSSLQSSTNPYLSLLIQTASDEKTEIAERAFILNLLSTKEFLKLSGGDFISTFDPSSHSFPSLDQLLQQYPNKTHLEPFNCYFKNAAIKNVIPGPDVPRGCDVNSSEPGVKPKIGSGDRDELLTGLIQTSSLEGLFPRWTRPSPPRLPVLASELVWVNPPNNTHEPLWDFGM